MGSLSALGFAEQVEEGNVSLRTALSWHLTSNHYPPVPTAFIQTCADAVEAGQDEEWDREIPLPVGCNTHHRLLGHNETSCEERTGPCDIVQAVDWKDGRPVATAGALIESFHLESFL